jgi:hypothetical protein
MKTSNSPSIAGIGLKMVSNSTSSSLSDSPESVIESNFQLALAQRPGLTVQKKP